MSTALDQRAGPYAALLLRVMLGVLFIAHLYWKFFVLEGGIARWWGAFATNRVSLVRTVLRHLGGARRRALPHSGPLCTLGSAVRGPDVDRRSAFLVGTQRFLLRRGRCSRLQPTRPSECTQPSMPASRHLTRIRIGTAGTACSGSPRPRSTEGPRSSKECRTARRGTAAIRRIAPKVSGVTAHAPVAVIDREGSHHRPLRAVNVRS
jgi:hypothetical protein